MDIMHGGCISVQFGNCDLWYLMLLLTFHVGSPHDGGDPQFLLVHARPFLLTYDPNALNPWVLSITTNRMPLLDGVSEVIGQVVPHLTFRSIPEFRSTPDS